MKGALLVAAVLVTVTGSVATEGARSEADYSRLILGRWLPRHANKYEIFYADGRWAVQRHLRAKPDGSGGRRWYIRGRSVTTTFDGKQYRETIVSISRTKMVTYVVPEEPLIYDRVR